MLKPEVESLVPGQSFDRRSFVKTALGSAFAAAVLPVTAQTIKTDFNGLTASEVTVTSGGFNMPVYRAQPEGKNNLPVVLVISEIFGVHEHIADICRRFAKLGYLAIAPELFARQGDPSSYGTIQELQTNIIEKVPDAQVMGDLDADLFAHFARDAVLHRLARLDETRQGAVHPRHEARRTGQQHLIATGHQHDHARRQQRVTLDAAAFTLHGAVAGHALIRLPAAAAEAVLPPPDADLAGEAEHGEDVFLGLHHELAQADPAGTLQRVGTIDFQQVHRLAIELPDGVLGKHGKVLALEPVTGEQHAVAVGKELLLAMGERPTTVRSHLEHRGFPTPGTHQAATVRPRALTLSLATSRTSGWPSGRIMAPPSR